MGLMFHSILFILVFFLLIYFVNAHILPLCARLLPAGYSWWDCVSKIDRNFISKQNIKIDCSDIHLFVQSFSLIRFLISFFVIKCLPIFRHSISLVPRGVPRVRWDFVFENENYIKLYNHWDVRQFPSTDSANYISFTFSHTGI